MFFLYLLSLPSQTSLFSFSSSLLVSILNSHADPPTFKNLDFMGRGLDSRKIKVFARWKTDLSEIEMQIDEDISSEKLVFQ